METESNIESPFKGISWRKVCKFFDNKKVQKEHSGWRKTLQECAIFSLGEGATNKIDLAQQGAINEETLTCPLPFPAIALDLPNRIFVVKDFWAALDGLSFGANILHANTLNTSTVIHIVETGEMSIRIQGMDVDTEIPVVVRTFFQGNAAQTTPPSYWGPEDRQIKEASLKVCFSLLLSFQSYINQESVFMVKQTPKKMGKTKPGAIPRLHSRPQYLVLDKTSIQARYASANTGSGKPVCPHLRRGHYRTLAAPRYKKPGQRIWVRATHVKGNTVEWREGDRFYKVI